jgi:hypothetical protein
MIAVFAFMSLVDLFFQRTFWFVARPLAIGAPTFARCADLSG